jgi:hypothetical protein
MNIRNILFLGFFFLCARINLSAQDKVVCKIIRRGVWHILEHSIQKTDSTTVISILIDSSSLSFVEIPNNFYDESDSIIIEIRKCTFLSGNENYTTSFCYIDGKYHISLWLDPKLFTIKEDGYNYYFYDVVLYYKTSHMYYILMKQKEK